MKPFSLLTLILFCATAGADVLFEGFYRLEKNGAHVGYAVQRVSTERMARTQTVTTYVRMRMPDGKEYFEAFKSVSQAPLLTPINSHYRGDLSGMYVDVQARFHKGRVTVEKRANKSPKPYQVETSRLVARRPFFSSFLFYVSDFKVLKAGKNYTFDTFIDRDGISTRGNLSVANAKTVGGLNHLHLVVDTSADPAESFVTESGFPLGSRSTTQDFVSYWVPRKQEAVGTFQFPNNEVIALFGDLPEGQKNPWVQIRGFDARTFISSFPKSRGPRATLSKQALKKISVGLPTRAPARAAP